MTEKTYLPPIKNFKYLVFSEEPNEQAATFDDLLEIIDGLTVKELNTLKEKITSELDNKAGEYIKTLENFLLTSGEYVKNTRTGVKFLARQKPNGRGSNYWTSFKVDIKIGDILEIKKIRLMMSKITMSFEVVDIQVKDNVIKDFKVSPISSSSSI